MSSPAFGAVLDVPRAGPVLAGPVGARPVADHPSDAGRRDLAEGETP